MQKIHAFRHKDMKKNERSMVVGARELGLSISEAADLLRVPSHSYLLGLQRMVQCTREWPDCFGLIASGYLSNCCLSRASLNTQHAQFWSRRVTSAEDHIGYYSSQIRTGKWGCEDSAKYCCWPHSPFYDYIHLLLPTGQCTMWQYSDHLKLLFWTWVYSNYFYSQAVQSNIIDALQTDLQQLCDATVSIWTKICENVE